jgi:hypothetical protein
MSVGLSKKQLVEMAEATLKAMNENWKQKPIDLIVYGCVTYRYESSANAHQSGFIYSLSRKSAGPSAEATFFDANDMNVPLERLFLRRYAFGVFYAD